MGTPRILTASRIKSFTTCQRKHYYRYGHELDAVVKGIELDFGTLLHEALETYWNWRKPGSDEKCAPEAALGTLHRSATQSGFLSEYGIHQLNAARVVLAKYIESWAKEEVTVLDVEKEFLLPMPHPVLDSNAGWFISGKIDLVIHDHSTDEICIVDHKFLSPKTDTRASSVTIKRLEFDPQISMYLLASEALGYQTKTFIYDVALKPTVQPYKATPVDKRRYKVDGSLYYRQYDHDEEPESYMSRVLEEYNDTVRLRKIPITRTDDQLQEFIGEIVAIADNIDRTNSAGDAIRNTGGCYSYGRLCPYIDSCGGLPIEYCEGLQHKAAFTELPELAAKKSEGI